jgi:hypothetical protein
MGVRNALLGRAPCPSRAREERPTQRSRNQEGCRGPRPHQRDREGLEHLLRCALRPPLSLERLSRAADGRVVLSLRRPLFDGTTAVDFTPTDLLRRLVALVPAPKRHTVRYFGVFAPSARVRAKVIREPALRRRRACKAAKDSDPGLDEEAVGTALRDELGFNPLALGSPPMPERARRLDWASLVHRVFQEDILQSAACEGRREVTAFIPGGPIAREILEDWGSTPPAHSPPRLALGRIRSTSTCILRTRAWIRRSRTEPTPRRSVGVITRSLSSLFGPAEHDGSRVGSAPVLARCTGSVRPQGTPMLLGAG